MAAARHRRARWQREIGESKVDMGLLAPLSPRALEMSLYTAVLDNDHQAIRDAARLGADPDMPVDGKLGEPGGTLLHFAVRHCTLKTVLALLQAGADPLLADAEGNIAKDVALQRPTGNRMRSVIELWEKKKDVTLDVTGSAAPEDAHNFDGTVTFDALTRKATS
ncbi:MAG: hypothetical protein PW788_05165 [Micavibrio sp.]|nr:hypothetical protein [Micavibrio sp.]